MTLTALHVNTASAQTNPNDFIEVFQQLSGHHAGERKGHAKGVCAVGDFTASEAGQQAFDIALFSGETLPTQFRFSMAGGNPHVPDYHRSPRGLAAQFTLPDGSKHNIATLTTPVFGAKNPENFLGLLQAMRPNAEGQMDAERIADFRRAHPDTHAQGAWLAAKPPPWSYTTTEYFGLHTFYIRDHQGDAVKIRWHLSPGDGIKG
ncbi:catalase [Alkalimonas collagenimarina]|uniref:catalase n=1 Tax=Alkalimonas collagenimarina TaxID=400390 RepID=A0ABT9GY24_9GAMM|nr:catalase [Alkalimonas collagenimarina]MDP4535951.1 catalase [Alkalimonas collagenimarina]